MIMIGIFVSCSSWHRYTATWQCSFRYSDYHRSGLRMPACT